MRNLKTFRRWLVVFTIGAIYGAQAPAAEPPLPPRPRFGDQYYTVDYPASKAPNELQTPVTYTVWIPFGVKQLRGVIVHQHGAGTTASVEGSTAAYDLHWQALARKWDCALMGPSYHVTNEAVDLTPGGSELWFDPRHGSEKTFLNALRELGQQSNHPELEVVPWILWGHSGGGIWSDVMATLHPDRVAAMWLRSGTASMFRSKKEFPQPAVPGGEYLIPTMTNPGIKEQGKNPFIGSKATFEEFRAHGAPIGLAPDPRTGHECGDSRYLAIPFLDACMKLRLPDKGSTDQKLKPVSMEAAWLAEELSDVAVPASQFKGDPKKAVWLPNEAVAKAWMDYVKTGEVTDTTPPPKPSSVSTRPSNDGILVGWTARPDFESGISQFVILRDGKEIARVPEKPVGKFGRPLFQSMTYHDTPSQPLPKMEYLDTSAGDGQQPNYKVITINGVGLSSEPIPGK